MTKKYWRGLITSHMQVSSDSEENMNTICRVVYYLRKAEILTTGSSSHSCVLGRARNCWSFSEAWGTNAYSEERSDIKHCRRDQKQRMCLETTSGKLCSKQVIRKGTTVLEMEFWEGQSSLMGSDTYQWLMAIALVTKAVNTRRYSLLSSCSH